MDPVLQERLRAAEEAVARLMECCQKNSPLHSRRVRSMVHVVVRTGKWLLAALGRFRHMLESSKLQG